MSSQMPTMEEFAQALSELPPEFKAKLAAQAAGQQAQQQQQQEGEIDTVAIKLELVKFATELRKHNQGVDWETNKIKPKQIEIKEVICDAQKLFDFITSEE